MDALSIDQARSRKWDVVVAGSSFASMFFVYALPTTLNVLIIEKGRIRDHQDLIRHGDEAPEKLSQTNTSAISKEWTATTLFGGNSNCWWGQTPRLHPDDFATRTRFRIGHDWLLSYDDLESLYSEVELIMEVAGGGSEHVLRRSQSFPFPPHAPSRSDRALRALSSNWFAAPCARSNGGRRAQCCASGVCRRCPVDAKFTILNSLDRFDRPGISLLLNAEVRAVRIDAGTARAAVVRQGGRDHEINGDLFGLGANAIFNSAIMLRSGLTAHALGRYLHEQVSRRATIDVAISNFFGGTSITGHGYHFYHSAPRDQLAAVLIENFNSPVNLRPLRTRWTERLNLKFIAEDLPSAENRVVLDHRDEPHIIWNGHSKYAELGLDRALALVADILPAPIEDMFVDNYASTENHILGTTRMGKDVAEGVVDRGLKCHEVRNLLALGAGVFPSCSPANPTLTLCALSLYAGRSL
jgi:choline dehydrogenase-like flavoprotein